MTPQRLDLGHGVSVHRRQATEVLVVGGRQRHDTSRPEWQRYTEGVILKVNLETGEVRDVLEYTSPPEAMNSDEEGSILFKSATLHGDRLYACTSTEVLVYSVPEFQLQTYISHPCFNDLHHVRPTPNGNLVVAVTGLDMVVELTPDGELVREWSVLGEDPWGRFSREVDYRMVLTTKPHRSHPNHVFYVDDELWVTRFLQKDAVSLSRPGRRIDMEVGTPHDGLVRGGQVYFTTVNGYVLVADLRTLEVQRRIDLNQLNSSETALGWCRGVEITSCGRLLVGFSRLRPTKFRENLQWLKRQLRVGEVGRQPNRVAVYGLDGSSLLSEIDLEPWGMDVVFSIHELPASVAAESAAPLGDRATAVV